MKIAYEPHPVSPERKKELRDQGFKILDAKFKPEEEKPEPKKAKKAATNKEAPRTPSKVVSIQFKFFLFGHLSLITRLACISAGKTNLTTEFTFQADPNANG